MRWWLALVWFAAIAWPSSAADKKAVPPTVEKATVPNTDEQKATRADVRRTLWQEYKKTTPAAALALADKLHKAAEESNHPPTRYVLWAEAAAAAVRGGDIDRAVQAVRKTHEHFREADPAELLTAAFVEQLGCAERRPDYRRLAEAELKTGTPVDPVRLPDLWKRAGEWIPSDQKGVAFRRGRQLTLAALADNQVKEFTRLKLDELRRKLTVEVEELDAKAGRFTLFEGRWRIHFGEHDSREWVVTADGQLTNGTKAEDPKPEGTKSDATKGEVVKRPPALRLTRRPGSVVVTNGDRQIIEDWKLTGDELTVKRFNPTDPTAKPTTGTGTRVSETLLTAKARSGR